MARVNIFGGPTIPQPLVEELPQDDAWDEWNKAVQTHEARFAPTAPAGLPESLPRAPIQRATPALSLHTLLQEAKRDSRVCPQPGPWTKLYVLLAQHRHGSVRLPAPPLVGPAWDKTPALAKKMSFHAHLEWASMHGCLQEVFDFLTALPEDQWHCGS